MAKELAHFRNFAKLNDTSLAFNDITVLVGKPGTGKSYVMKMMYAISEAYSKIKVDIENASYKTKEITDKSKNIILRKLKV